MNAFQQLAVDYSYTSTSSSSADGAALGAFFVIYLVFVLAIYLVASFLLSKVFKKAGRPAWEAFVPIYNTWVLFELGGKPGWLILLAFIPFVGGLIVLVISLLVSLELAKRFGKSSVFGIFGLWLFSLIGYAILAFDNSTYHGPGGAAPAQANSGSPTTPEVFANNTPPNEPPVNPPTPPNLVQ